MSEADHSRAQNGLKDWGFVVLRVDDSFIQGRLRCELMPDTALVRKTDMVWFPPFSLTAVLSGVDKPFQVKVNWYYVERLIKIQRLSH